MLFLEDTREEMDKGLFERLDIERGFFVSRGSPPTGRPGGLGNMTINYVMAWCFNIIYFQLMKECSTLRP